MNSKKTIIPKILVTIIILAIITVVGGKYLSKYLQEIQWAAVSIDTQAMSDTRKLHRNGKLVSSSLLPEAITVDKCKLYNAILYTQVHTVICTVKRPEQFSEFAAYLISDTGKVYPGWYNPESMGDISTERYGIIKVIFEGLSTNQITELHLVDKKSVSDEYDPKSDIPRIVFSLMPPTKAEIDALTSSNASGLVSSDTSESKKMSQ